MAFLPEKIQPPRDFITCYLKRRWRLASVNPGVKLEIAVLLYLNHLLPHPQTERQTREPLPRTVPSYPILNQMGGLRGFRTIW